LEAIGNLPTAQATQSSAIVQILLYIATNTASPSRLSVADGVQQRRILVSVAESSPAIDVFDLWLLMELNKKFLASRHKLSSHLSHCLSSRFTESDVSRFMQALLALGPLAFEPATARDFISSLPPLSCTFKACIAAYMHGIGLIEADDRTDGELILGESELAAVVDLLVRQHLPSWIDACSFIQRITLLPVRCKVNDFASLPRDNVLIVKCAEVSLKIKFGIATIDDLLAFHHLSFTTDGSIPAGQERIREERAVAALLFASAISGDVAFIHRFTDNLVREAAGLRRPMHFLHFYQMLLSTEAWNFLSHDMMSEILKSKLFLLLDADSTSVSFKKAIATVQTEFARKLSIEHH